MRKLLSGLIASLLLVFYTNPIVQAQVIAELTPNSNNSVVAIGDAYQEVLPSVNQRPDYRLFIVQLNPTPLGVVRANVSGMNPNAQNAMINQANTLISKTLDRLKRDISRIERNTLDSRSLEGGQKAKLRHVYRFSLVGVAIYAHEDVIAQVKNLQYVLQVEEEVLMQANDATTNGVIGLPCYLTPHPTATGTGVRIGIVDTGVDYNHTDLGGGFGGGFRVVDGWDFVNLDPDPLDDNGHGTHVAGIAAANGGVMGVAPDATLYAYKVLNAAGNGSNADVIAGIDRCVDPDLNPLTFDQLDVLNASLGGPGNAGDLTSQAIDNATAAGVVCAVAAGNSGPSYSTIGSPGCAFSAVTVGANDNSNVIASFSSRGPANAPFFNLKPDVTAPGVMVNSTWLGGTYNSINGTSMATPHVAGAAALLKQEHPTWTPAMIKSFLMQTAFDIGYDVWTQGQGRIDFCEMTNRENDAMVTPGSISFGLVDCAVNPWVVTEDIEIFNVSSTPTTFNVSVNMTPIPGVTPILSSSTVTVAANSSSIVTFTLSVDPGLCPVGTGTPPDYTGEVVVASPSFNYNVPFAFRRSNGFNITFSDPPDYFWIHDGSSMVEFQFSPGTSYISNLPNGTYDIITSWDQHKTWVVLENVVLNACAVPVFVNKADAVNEVTIAPVDASSGVLDLQFQSFGYSNLRHKNVNFFVLSGWHSNSTGVPWDKIYFNNVSNNYTYEGRVRKYANIYGYNVYEYPMEFDQGISSSFTVTNTPADWTKLVFDYDDSDPAVQELFYFPQLMYVAGNATYQMNTFFATPSPNIYRLTPPPFGKTAYILPTSNNNRFRYLLHRLFNTTFNQHPLSSDQYYQTAAYKVDNVTGITESFAMFDWNHALYVENANSHTIRVGSYAPRFAAETFNTPSYISLRNAPGRGIYQDMYGNIRRHLVPWTVTQGVTTLASGTLDNIGSPSNNTLYTGVSSTGVYEIRSSYDQYWINGTQGYAKCRLLIDYNAGPFPKPPVLRRFEVRGNGQFADNLTAFQDNQVVLEIEDPDGFAEIRLQYRLVGGPSVWYDMGLVDQGGNILVADIPCNLTQGFYHLRLYAEDNTGQELEYIVSPAFYFHNSGLTPLPSWSWVNQYGSNYRVADLRNDPSGNSIIAGVNATQCVVAKVNRDGIGQWVLPIPNAGVYALATDGAGDIYATGTFQGTINVGTFTLSSTSGYDIWYAKIKTDGTVEWAFSSGGTAGNEFARDIAVNENGQVFLPVTYTGTSNFGGLSLFGWGGLDAYLIKIDSDGTPMYAHPLNSATTDFAMRVGVDYYGNVYVAGSFDGSLNLGSGPIVNFGDRDVYIVKYQDMGSSFNYLWHRTLTSTTGKDVRGLDVSPEGRVAMNGWMRNTASLNGWGLTAGTGNSNCWFASLDPSGNVEFANTYTGSDQNQGMAIAYDDYGHLVNTGWFRGTISVGGFSHTATSSQEVIAVRYDQSGNILNRKQIGAPSFGFETVVALDSDPSGNFYFLGGHQQQTSFDAITIITGTTTTPWHAKLEWCAPAAWNGLRTQDPALADAGTGFFDTDGNLAAESSAGAELNIQVWPNPSAGQIDLEVNFPEAVNSVIEVRDLTGRRVALIHDGLSEAGSWTHSVDLRAQGLESGMYFIRLQAGEEVRTLKITLQ